MAGSPRGRRPPASSLRAVPTPRAIQSQGRQTAELIRIHRHPHLQRQQRRPSRPKVQGHSRSARAAGEYTRILGWCREVRQWAGMSAVTPSQGLRGRLRRRYGLWLWFGFRRGQRSPPPGSRRWCRRLWLWSGRRPWRRRRVRRPRSRRRLRMRHRRRLRWSGRPASRAARRRVRRGLRQARPVVMAARTLASGEPACGEVRNG